LLILPVSAIEPNGYQPRRRFDEEGLTALAESIRELGVLQPVLVRPAGAERFELVAGERRWRAAQQAGLRMIPAIVRSTADRGALEQAIVENLHREDLNALEEASAYQQLVDDFGLTQDEVAKRVGKSRSAVSNTLRLFQLAPAVQRMVADGRLSAGHARALLGVDDARVQTGLAQQVVEDELSVRQTERAVREAVDGRRARAKGRGSGEPGGASIGSKSAAALEVERVLEDRLDTSVDVQEGGAGGRIVVRFADAEDLARIFGLL
jgi:ParB family chromosome partitioning protein